MGDWFDCKTYPWNQHIHKEYHNSLQNVIIIFEDLFSNIVVLKSALINLDLIFLDFLIHSSFVAYKIVKENSILNFLKEKA